MYAVQTLSLSSWLTGAWLTKQMTQVWKAIKRMWHGTGSREWHAREEVPLKFASLSGSYCDHTLAAVVVLQR